MREFIKDLRTNLRDCLTLAYVAIIDPETPREYCGNWSRCVGVPLNLVSFSIAQIVKFCFRGYPSVRERFLTEYEDIRLKCSASGKAY